jgi:hypothetical protein
MSHRGGTQDLRVIELENRTPLPAGPVELAPYQNIPADSFSSGI